ncbi:acyl-CoA thioesterase [Qipengyuania qiaonensis]|uniref:Acyl-CoA thioesterase n=1 Tax=Qipengyuania qiaonensis TaxID=2867240 RepID=A0ABS7J5P0_9SPHN|nr:acyl-CoA thioesterase [Qipengyuania qiaonensis]MBX7482650.1 acyl-CoA thioesterase [Qipengyuania qiaonensis]
MSEETMPAGEAAIRVTAVPADTNVYGDIFGGWLMAQMDLAASAVASRHSGGRAVTIAVDGMTFHRPVFVGDEVSVFATLEEVGRTSMKVAVATWRRDRHSDEAYLVTRARFTFVAIGQDRRPRNVKPMTAAV